MARTSRAELQRLEAAIKERAGSDEVRNVLAWLGLSLEVTKAILVTCPQEDFARIQGEAQGYDKLIRALTRADIYTKE